MDSTNADDAPLRMVNLAPHFALLGGVIGAFVVNGAKSWFTVALPDLWLYVLGALFVAVTLFFPRGLVGALESALVRVRK